MLDSFVPRLLGSLWAVLAAGGVLGPARAASLCERGLRQSPLDIAVARPVDLPALQWQLRPVPLNIGNDGHTARVRLAGAGRLLLGGRAYAVQQLHWHTPGGDRIDGEVFPMAAHLLHKGADGQLLPVVIPLRLGADDALLAQVLPRIPARADGDHVIAEQQVDLRLLLPAERGYYRYSGSLTGPPCTEGVQWLVLKTPMTVSATQLAAWRRHFADNIRAPQPLNGREVLQSR